MVITSTNVPVFAGFSVVLLRFAFLCVFPRNTHWIGFVVYGIFCTFLRFFSTVIIGEQRAEQ